MSQSLEHHYVPQWYQRRFLDAGQDHFYYLDLYPESVTSKGGTRYRRNALLRWGPKKCFFQKELYTLKLGQWSTDEVETYFFGQIDTLGQKAVELFGNYSRYSDAAYETFGPLVQYMGAQRFRTPRGLDRLKLQLRSRDHNMALIALQQLFQYDATMWSEGVWEIVRAQRSPTKFIVTDEPVSFFNAGGFYQKECQYPMDVELGQVGTRTLFPLGLDACLIITHLQLVRNPWLKPKLPRVNARSYQQTVKSLLDIQFGRELEEDEVVRINYIIRKCARRYIAAAEEEWLYPGQKASETRWSQLDDDWFLLPNLYKVPFTRGIVMGWKDGSGWAMDEYGRHPGDSRYEDKALSSREWTSHLDAQRAWANKRRGRSIAQVDDFTGRNSVGDSLLQGHLSGVVHPAE
jgi:hypothetical protein